MFRGMILGRTLMGRPGIRVARRTFCAAGEPAVTLYQYEICPFCSKAKALLDYHSIPYRTVEVNPVAKKELAFTPDYKKVPIAVIDGEQFNGSMDIVARCAELAKAKTPSSASKIDAAHSADAQKWQTWSDDKFAVYLYPNMTNTFSEAWKMFKYVYNVPSFAASGFFSKSNPYALHVLGSLATSAAHGKIKKKHGIVDERKELYALANEWVEEVGSGPFRGGEAPDVGDLSVYGAFKVCHGQQVHSDVLAECPGFEPWLTRMADTVGESSRTVRA